MGQGISRLFSDRRTSQQPKPSQRIEFLNSKKLSQPSADEICNFLKLSFNNTHLKNILNNFLKTSCQSDLPITKIEISPQNKSHILIHCGDSNYNKNEENFTINYMEVYQHFIKIFIEHSFPPDAFEGEEFCLGLFNLNFLSYNSYFLSTVLKTHKDVLMKNIDSLEENEKNILLKINALLYKMKTDTSLSPGLGNIRSNVAKLYDSITENKRDLEQIPQIIDEIINPLAIEQALGKLSK